MKYYRRKYESNIESIEYDYEKGEVPVNKPLWGFAYNIKNDTAHRKYFSKPILGELRETNHSYSDWATFYPYKINGDICVSKGVNLNARYYADTYEEAVEMYNELVRNRIDRLHEAIMDAEKDFILMTITVDKDAKTVTTKRYDTDEKTITQVDDIDGWYE